MMKLDAVLQHIEPYKALSAQLRRDAIDLFEKQINHPGTAVDLARIGGYRLEQSNFAAAAEFYARAIEVDSSQPRWHFDYAVALSKLGQIDKAKVERKQRFSCSRAFRTPSGCSMNSIARRAARRN